MKRKSKTAGIGIQMNLVPHPVCHQFDPRGVVEVELTRSLENGKPCRDSRKKSKKDHDGAFRQISKAGSKM